MNLEKQVCSLENSKKLIELGFKIESHLYWYKEGDDWLVKHFNQHWMTDYPAYSPSELMDILPSSIIVEKTPEGYEIGRRILNLNDIDKFRIDVLDENLVNGLARYLIYLIENKILAFGKCEIVEYKI